MRRALAAMILGLAFAVRAAPALAVEPDEMLKDPVLEERAREISKHLRCLVCQNQSIDDSNADLAKDLRLLVRARLKAGDSDEAVVRYIVARYGDFVLLKPPVKPATYVLWFGPALVLLVALTSAILFLRRRRAAVVGEAKPAPLTAAERKRLDALLEDGEGAP